MREQRRLVTVVFADVVGSTALAEELDPEDVRAIFTRYYAVANEVVAAHGGIVAKLLGDGVLACFGIPTAHGDDAQRALDAALALRERVSREAGLERLQLRIGVNTGEVLANEDASGEIVGDAVNVAARVAAAATEGEILAADSTHRSAAAMAYGDPRDIAAKGKSQPVRVWPLSGRGHQPTWTTPFVGRRDDLAQLELAARRAFRDGRPQIVTITAPTGTGKSRLVQEFRDGLGPEPWYAHAHCPPYGETLAFAPLHELLFDLLSLSPDTPPDDLRRQIGAIIDTDSSAQDAILVAASVAPDAMDAQRDRDDVIAAWRNMLSTLAFERPLFVVLEDLHNASDSLLDLIEQVAQPATHAPLLLVCVARPELLQRRPTWGAGRGNSIHLALEPLADDEIADLVARLLETEPPAQLRELIVDRAAGNPFFAEELIRSILERGPIDLRDPEAVTRALRALPETVQATLLSRLDALGPDERAVVQAAAVAGRSFSGAIVRSLTDLEEPIVRRALDRLAERDLVRNTSGDDWTFHNTLVRDVAYGTLPRTRRVRDHLVIAKYLEGVAAERADEVAGAIGRHYLEATRLRRASALTSDADAGAIEEARRGAVTWLTRGALANRVAGAWAESIAQFQDAAAIATDDERLMVLVHLTEAAGGGDEAWDAAVEALRLWRARGDADPALGSRIIVGLIVTEVRSGISVTPEKLLPPERLEELAAEALDLARTSGNEAAMAAARVVHAYLGRERGHRMKVSLDPSRDEAASAAAVLERREAWYLWSLALDAWASILGDQGDFVQARQIAQRRVDRADLLNALERPHAHWTMPLYLMALGEIAGSRDHIERAITTPVFLTSRWARVAGFGELFLRSWRAATNWTLGEWDAAIADAREALVQVIPRIPDNSNRSLFRDAGCAAVYAARRRERADLVDEFGPQLRQWCDDERSLALLDDDPSQLDIALGRVESAGIDLWQVERSVSLLAAYGRVPVTAERLDALVVWAEPRKLRPLLAQLLRLRARARRSVDDARRARELLAECGMRADAALAAVEMAELGDRSALSGARDVLETLGDRRGLAAVEAIG